MAWVSGATQLVLVQRRHIDLCRTASGWCQG
ncbi:putative leader peptide [Antrihabitans stalactiti]